MNLNTDNDDFIPIPEPSINDTRIVSIGKGTVGLGAYVSPLQQVAKNCMIKEYLAKSEDRRGRTLAHRAHERSVRRHMNSVEAAAENRRNARMALHEKRETELQAALEVRQRQHHLNQLEREKQREQRKELIDAMATHKKQQQEASHLAKEERRRNYEHGMMERRERQQQEREAALQERLEQEEAQERKAAWRRERALASKHSAAEAVKEMKAKQKAEVQKRKAELDNKLQERRAGYAKDLHENQHHIHLQKSSHAKRMMELSHKIQDERAEIVEATKLHKAIPTAGRIEEDRAARKKVERSRADEIRRARTVMW